MVHIALMLRLQIRIMVVYLHYPKTVVSYKGNLTLVFDLREIDADFLYKNIGINTKRSSFLILRP